MNLPFLPVSSLRVGILFGLVLCVCAAGQWMRRRRIRSFGDPKVLGIGRPWHAGIWLALLWALGLTCVASILWLPEDPGERLRSSPSLIKILVDAKPPVGGVPPFGSLWEELSDAIHLVVTEAAGARCAVYRPAEVPEQVVPPTHDSQGVMIMAARLGLDWQQEASSSIDKCVRALLSPDIPQTQPAVRVVVISSRPADEIAEIFPPAAQSALVFVIRTTAETGTMQFGGVGANGSWEWSSEPAQVRGFLQAEARAEGLPGRAPSRWNPMQGLALTAFLSLLVGSFHSWLGRSGSEIRTLG